MPLNIHNFSCCLQNAFHQNLLRMRDFAANLSVTSLPKQKQEASDVSYATITMAEDSVQRNRSESKRDSKRDIDDRLARLSRRFDPGRF